MNRSSLRSAFALLLTLSVLTVIFVLFSVMLGMLEKSQKKDDDIKALIEANRLFSDLKSTFAKVGTQNKETLMEILYEIDFPIRTKESEFGFTIGCDSLRNKIDINWLRYENNESMRLYYEAVTTVLGNTLVRYEVRQPAELERMLKAAVSLADSDKEKTFEKNDIISFESLLRILDRYELRTGDGNVRNIPWEDIFSFRRPIEKNEKLDRKHMSPLVMSLLLDTDEAFVKEELETSPEVFDTLLMQNGKEAWEKLFSKKFLDESECRVTFVYKDIVYGFRFEDKKGRISDFEFLGKQ